MICIFVSCFKNLRSPDQRVDFGDLDVVELLDCDLDLRLVRAFVDDEDQRVVVLDLLHCRLSRERVVDDLELIQTAKRKNVQLTAGQILGKYLSSQS